MPVLRGTRPLKRWRYVGVFCEELMLCAGDAYVGPARQTWWAVWDRAERRLYEHTARLRHRHVGLEPGRLRIRAADVDVDLDVDEQAGVETVCPDGRAYVWTRKQAGVPAHGRVTLGGREIHLDDALAVVDDTAGYHARHTAWRWSAGVGEGPDGQPLAWNLVEGVNDPLRGSERSLWVDGVPRELSPVTFDPQLEWLRFSDGAELRFACEAERARSDNLVLIRSEYRQPFGTFSGTFPDGVALAHGLGVMERHSALW
jgi:hypothetical protein